MSEPAIQIRVGGASESGATAHAIVRNVLEQRRTGVAVAVHVRAIAPQAVSTATKAIIVASGLLAPKGVDLYVRPYFDDARGNDGGTVTVIVLRLCER